ncbi:hypothetical protein WJX72_004598 [[Myrmecia] bisecta]|uniref:Protein kinase domain-containing protein n=1 Tax=[Myrmecia] bisecta TaxID=41462 RepID=A0AAW1Q746_9CHLO
MAALLAWTCGNFRSKVPKPMKKTRREGKNKSTGKIRADVTAFPLTLCASPKFEQAQAFHTAIGCSEAGASSKGAQLQEVQLLNLEGTVGLVQQSIDVEDDAQAVSVSLVSQDGVCFAAFDVRTAGGTQACRATGLDGRLYTAAFRIKKIKYQGPSIERIQPSPPSLHATTGRGTCRESTIAEAPTCPLSDVNGAAEDKKASPGGESTTSTICSADALHYIYPADEDGPAHRYLVVERVYSCPGRGVAVFKAVLQRYDHKAGAFMRSGPLVAVKALRITGDGDNSSAIKHEVDMTQQLANTPYTIDSYGCCQAVDQLQQQWACLVLGWETGGTLAELVAKNAAAQGIHPTDLCVAEQTVHSILHGLTKGMEVLHSSVHRDLKLDNVLLSCAGLPRISDFGQTTVLKAGGRMTTRPCGTNMYQAVELAHERRMPDTAERRWLWQRHRAILYPDYGPTIDVFAIGYLVFALLTGDTPIHVSTALAKDGVGATHTFRADRIRTALYFEVWWLYLR